MSFFWVILGERNERKMMQISNPNIKTPNKSVGEALKVVYNIFKTMNIETSKVLIFFANIFIAINLSMRRLY